MSVPLALREAISYGRFSAKPQEEGDSTSRQRESYERVCQRYATRCLPSDRFAFGHFFGKGESGFKAEHLADGGSLAALITAMESGQIVPSKTVIVIEAFDRLGRLAPDLATGLLSQIVRAGCAIAVDRPDCWIGSVEDLNGMGWLQVQAMLFVAHEESKQKSGRLRSAWGKKKEKASEKPLTGVLPSWLRMERGKIVENKISADLLRRIFEEAAAGLGGRAIVSAFHKEAILSIGRKRNWSVPYVCRLLNDRRVIGEYQPYRKVGNKRVKEGPPVQGYFPQTIPLELWYRVQNQLAPRRKAWQGRDGRVINILAGILKDEQTTTNYQQLNKGKYRYLVSAAAFDGRSEWLGLPLVEFEKAFLTFLWEFDPSTLDHKAPGDLTARLEAAKGEVEAAKAVVAALKARLLRSFSEALADVLEQGESRHKDAEKLLWMR